MRPIITLIDIITCRSTISTITIRTIALERVDNWGTISIRVTIMAAIGACIKSKRAHLHPIGSLANICEKCIKVVGPCWMANSAPSTRYTRSNPISRPKPNTIVYSSGDCRRCGTINHGAKWNLTGNAKAGERSSIHAYAIWVGQNDIEWIHVHIESHKRAHCLAPDK